MCRLQLFQVGEDSPDGCRIKCHQLQGKCDQAIMSRADPPEVQVLENAGVAGENHVVYRQRLALTRIDRWRVDPYEFQAEPEEISRTVLAQRRPGFRKRA